ncbi:hypothetical protein BJP32_09945 [Brevundimonas sp. ZS04]|nr:hypothetical protein BJP32_09945 [Brevundimonas sp. ZS04]
MNSLFLPSPLVGEGGRRSLTDEGSRHRSGHEALAPVEETPHPSPSGPPSPTRGEGRIADDGGGFRL